jgi:uncharacterized protein YdbL (DUF1318 family)
MLPDMAPSTPHQQDGHVPAHLREALAKLASLPGSSDALVARMALANVGRNMDTEEVAERLDVAPAAVAKVAGLNPYARVAGGTAPLYLLSDVEAAAARQAESGYVVETVARGRHEFRMRRDERAAARGSAEAAHRAAVPLTGAPTGAWMA